MKKLTLATLLALASLTGVAQAETLTLDPAHSVARFSVDHFGTSTNHGAFHNLNGQVNYDPVKKTGFVGITIPIMNLETGIDAFNKHLKSADFFNTDVYPTAYFKSTQWHFKGDKPVKIDGELTLLGKTHPITLTATKFNCYDNPIHNAKTCGGDFETVIDRTKWGMTQFADLPSMRNVKLKIQAEAYAK